MHHFSVNLSEASVYGFNLEKEIETTLSREGTFHRLITTKREGFAAKNNLACSAIDCGSDLSPVTGHPTPVFLFPSLRLPPITRPPSSPTAREFPGCAGRALDGMREPDAAGHARQPQLHVGHLLAPPAPAGLARGGC